jgi:hypothetical protein
VGGKVFALNDLGACFPIGRGLLCIWERTYRRDSQRDALGAYSPRPARCEPVRNRDSQGTEKSLLTVKTIIRYRERLVSGTQRKQIELSTIV